MTGQKNGKRWVSNAFSLNMLNLLVGGEAVIRARRLTLEEFCKGIREDGVESAIGHEGTVALVNTLCGTALATNRVNIKLADGDVLYAITVATRLPEGRVLSIEELKAMLDAGQIAFWQVSVE